jgi:hypothetical protein
MKLLVIIGIWIIWSITTLMAYIFGYETHRRVAESKEYEAQFKKKDEHFERVIKGGSIQ